MKHILDEIAQTPGVEAVGAINETPLNTGGSSTPVYREGTRDFRDSNIMLSSMFYSVSPGYLRASGTRLLQGRDIAWNDSKVAPKVALVNSTFAHALFGDASPVGRHFLIGENGLIEIAGVMEDGKYNSLSENPMPAMFFPAAQYPSSDLSLVVRSSLPAPYVARILRNKLGKIDPNLAFTINTWPDALTVVFFPAQVATASLGVMGLLAAVLTVTGVFGMAAYTISKRWKELGIRVSLGAQHIYLIGSALARPLVILTMGSMLACWAACWRANCSGKSYMKHHHAIRWYSLASSSSW